MPAWTPTFTPNLDTADEKLLRPYVEVEAYRRSLLKTPLPPGFKRKLDKINIVRQIRGTTAIEGNALTEQQVEKVIEEGNPETVAEQEANNAYQVHRFIVQWHHHHPDGIVTEELIRSLHRITTQSIRYDANEPGRYRNHDETVGDYCPPTYDRVPGLVSEFVHYINSAQVRERYGPLLRAILAHFYLISIHPFGDGNGRTSRGLEAFVLYSGGYNVHGFYSLSNFYYRRRGDYVRELMDARFEHQGRLQAFAIFSLEGFVEELQAVQEEILRYVLRLVYRDYLDQCYSSDRISARCEALARILLDMGSEGISLVEFRSKKHPVARELFKHHKSVRTIDRDLQALERNGLVKVNEGRLMCDLDYIQSLSSPDER